MTLPVGLGLMIVGTFFTGAVEATDTTPEVTGWLKDIFGLGFHYMGAVFVVLIVLQLSLGAAGMKRNEPYVQQDAKLVDLTPWKPAPYVGAGLILFVIAIYVYFAI